MLYLETWGDAIRIVGVFWPREVLVVVTTEIFVGAGSWGALPPTGSSISTVIPILRLAVPCRVIAVLFKIIWFLL